MFILVFQRIIINFSITEHGIGTVVKKPSKYLSFGMGTFTYLQCVPEKTAVSLIISKQYMGKVGEIAF